MANFVIHGEIKISKAEKFEAIIWIKRKDTPGFSAHSIKASSPSIGFDLISKYYAKEIEKWGLSTNG